MVKVIEHAGDRFGRLLVVERSQEQSSQGRAMWRCQCDCGAEKTVSGPDLRAGKIRSCGCARMEMLRSSGRKHGQWGTPSWFVWRDMRKRCQNQNHEAYKYYGGRGITFHPRWNEFSNFLADMGERPPGMTLERVDVNGNYEPSNCEWIPASEQARNTRRTIRVTIDGERMCLKQACSRLGLSYPRVRDRVRTLGWSVEDALRLPKKINGALFAQEETK